MLAHYYIWIYGHTFVFYEQMGFYITLKNDEKWDKRRGIFNQHSLSLVLCDIDFQTLTSWHRFPPCCTQQPPVCPYSFPPGINLCLMLANLKADLPVIQIRKMKCFIWNLLLFLVHLSVAVVCGWRIQPGNTQLCLSHLIIPLTIIYSQVGGSLA